METAKDNDPVLQPALPVAESATYKSCIDLNPELDVYEPIANQYRVDQYQYDSSNYYPATGSTYSQASFEEELTYPMDPHAVSRVLWWPVLALSRLYYDTEF